MRGTAEELIKSMVHDNAEFFRVLHECEDVWNNKKSFDDASKVTKIVFRRYCAYKEAEQAYNKNFQK